ncbi:protocadherin-like wing polarity protein stan [Haliotis rubra]|uniref:protocadherin-like wing polarity protein stan n=1 Tax=Haliotis rubra TaxID=36100 RepID=UPI001EE53279|nr:protocadherin-like wing polarity protein stan [Haliotis rubra]
MDNWLFVYLVSIVIEPILSGTYIQAETDSQHKIVAMNERGLPITGQNSLIFQIKACSNAYFVLSEKYRFSKPDQRFFLVILGATATSSVNGIRDSCLRSCDKPSAKKVGQWLHCSTFRTFWLAWDEHGGLGLGSGAVALRNSLMKLRSPRPFPLNFLFLWGQDNAPQFVFPRPYGGSTVEIPENTDIKKVILDLKATDQDKDMLKFSVVGEHSYTFKCAGSSLVLMNPVDYEEQSLYNVQIRAFDGSYASVTHLTVIVTDVNDNAPEVDRIDPIEIPEQLPEGSVIGAITSARDVDTNDKITFSLEERDSSYFSVDPNTGLLYIRRTVDLEAMSVTSYIANMTLIVTDVVGHSTSTAVIVIVNDINDNPPAFLQDEYHINISETSSGDVELITFTLYDPDVDPDANISLSLRDVSDVFYLQDRTLVCATDRLKYDNQPQYTLKVEARDKEKMGRQNTATVTVVVEVLPVVKRALAWMTGANGRLPRVTLSRRVPPGSAVTVLIASQSCSGTDGHVFYRILSVKDEKERQVAGAYTIDAKTGQVTTTESFNKNVAVYNCLHVQAYDLHQPDRFIDGWVSVDVHAVTDDPRDDLVGAESCKTQTELLLLQSMVGILSFCLLVSSCVIVCKRKSPIKVYPIK